MKQKERIPVVLDTDPGVDDLFAILLAASSDRFDLRAITAVAGNCPLAMTGRNALAIAERFHIDVPVYLGADRPIVGKQATAEYMHGSDGLGGLCWKPERKLARTEYAWEAIIHEAEQSEGKLVVIAIGPLTNVAIALLHSPKIADKIERIIFMGGSTTVGNITPYAEFNLYADPVAAEVVLRAGIPLYMVGLNVTEQAVFYRDDFGLDALPDSPVKQTADYLAEQMTARYQQYGYQGILLHDLLAVASVIDEKLLEWKHYHVAIERKSELNYGRTVVDTEHINEPGKPNCYVAVSVDKERAAEHLRMALRHFARER